MKLNFLLVTFVVCGRGTLSLGFPENSDSLGALERVYLGEARKSAALGKEDFTRKQLLESIAAALAKTGAYDGALDIVQGIYPMGFEALKEIGKGMVAAGKATQAKAWVNRLQGDEGQSLLFMVVEAEAMAGRIDEAIATANTIHVPEVKGEAIRSIAVEQVKAGNLAAARETFRKWPEPEAGPRETPALLADRVTSAVAEALAPKGPGSALQMVSTIRDPQEKEATYFGIVFALLNQGDMVNAKRAFTKAREHAGSHAAGYFIAYVQAKLGMISEALQTARAFDVRDPDAEDAQEKALTTIAILQAERGDTKASLKTVAEIGTHQTKPGTMTKFERREALLWVARAQTNAGDPRGAIETLKGISISGPTDYVLRSGMLFETAYAWAKAPEFSKALAAVIEMPKAGVGLVPGERADAVWTLATVEANNGKAENAALWAASLSDPTDRAAAYLGIAEGLLGKKGIETQEFFPH